MIKVLNITSDKNIGGAGRCILNFLAHYDRAQFSVEVCLPRGSLLIPEILALDTKVIEVDGIENKSLDWKAISALKKVIGDQRAQIVHTHGAMSGRIAGRQRGVPVVYTRHSVFPPSPKISKQPGKWLNGKINEHYADAILAVAEAAKENLVDSGINPKKVEVILNGVPPVKPLPPEETIAQRARLNIPQDAFVGGILARLDLVKGHAYLLEAVKLCKEQGRPFFLVIAGTGAEEEALKSQAESLGILEHVRFLGFVSDIQQVLGILDIQLNASFGTEATSLALLEGMSLGIPAVVTDYGGNPGVIQNGRNGLLVPIKDPEALARAVSQVMEDPEAYAKMVHGAREIFQEKFTADIYAKNIEAVYHRLLRKDK